MVKEKKNSEDIIALISSVLEEVYIPVMPCYCSCPNEDTVFEAAPLHYKLATFLIDSAHVHFFKEAITARTALRNKRMKMMRMRM